MKKTPSGSSMQSKTSGSSCPQCLGAIEKTAFDVGYGVAIESSHCKSCGFTITDSKKLHQGLLLLRENMQKEVKVIRIGEGLGIRFPNDLVKNYHLHYGEEMILKPEVDGIKIVPVESH